MGSITSRLHTFLDESDAVIHRFTYSKITEDGRIQASNRVNELRKSAEAINTLLHIHRDQIRGCSVKKINDRFDVESIKGCKNTNYATKQAIDSTCAKIKIARTQALELYNHLSPDNLGDSSFSCDGWSRLS